MKSSIAWLLILLTIHAPVPFPDLDGEDHGVPIGGLAEMQAWHVLLLGIRPADDIDRGPIRQNDSEHPATPDETPVGKLSVISAAPNVGELIAFADVIPFSLDHAPLLSVDSCLIGVTARWRDSPSLTLWCRRLAQLCIWRV